MKTFSFHAYHLTDRAKLTSVLSQFPDKPFRASGTELAYRFGKNQYLIIYNFGSIVFFDVDPQREEQILQTLKNLFRTKDEVVTREDFALSEGPNQEVEFRKVLVDEITYERIQIVSLVLAQSTALDSHEGIVDKMLEISGTFSDKLERSGKIGRQKKDLIKFVGFCLSTKQKVISSTYLLDNPDPTWEDPSLEQLYRKMGEMFEIRDRFRTLEYKLKTIQETIEILSDLSRSQRSLYLEVAIVILISLEFLFFLFERLSR